MAVPKLSIRHIIQLCAFLVLLGRAYQFYFFGAPFRSILWDESLLSPIVEGIFGTPWNDYATSPAVNSWIGVFTKFSAGILFLASIISLFWGKISFLKLKKTILFLAVIILFFLYACMVKDKNYDLLQLFEQSIQMASPLLLLTFRKESFWKSVHLDFWLKIAFALTFIPHGLFAMGIPYAPGNFIDMTITILGVSETTARQFLFIVGFIDIVASFALFVPGLIRYSLIYMVIWGILTAFARIVAGFDSEFLLSSMNNHIYLTVYRLPHGLLPLGSLLYFHRKSYLGRHD